MRKIDWESSLSDEDIAWLRQAGYTEEFISRHQEQFGGDVPEIEQDEDTVTQSALDPQARMRGEPVPVDSAPVNLSPEPGSRQAGDALIEESETDDYDQWKVNELNDEVQARNDIAAEREGVTEVTVEGTGKDGAVRKPDLVKALRVWDQQNPGVLS